MSFKQLLCCARCRTFAPLREDKWGTEVFYSSGWTFYTTGKFTRIFCYKCSNQFTDNISFVPPLRFPFYVAVATYEISICRTCGKEAKRIVEPADCVSFAGTLRGWENGLCPQCKPKTYESS